MTGFREKLRGVSRLSVLSAKSAGMARGFGRGRAGTVGGSSSGFAVVELLITLIIMGLAFGAFTVTFTTIQNINKKALDINKANTLAFAKVQQYENQQFTALPTTTPTGTLQEVEDFSSSLPTVLESPRVGKVYINTVSGTLKQVVVTIEFGSGSSQRIVQYADFIQKNGLGR